MNIKEAAPADHHIIREVKTAIRARKYAHVDEINQLWQYAMKSSGAVKWSQIATASAIICLITLLTASLTMA